MLVQCRQSQTFFRKHSISCPKMSQIKIYKCFPIHAATLATGPRPESNGFLGGKAKDKFSCVSRPTLHFCPDPLPPEVNTFEKLTC